MNRMDRARLIFYLFVAGAILVIIISMLKFAVSPVSLLQNQYLNKILCFGSSD